MGDKQGSPCRFLFGEDLIKLAYKHLKSVPGRSMPALDGKILDVIRRKNEYSDYNSSDEQSLTFDSYMIPANSHYTLMVDCAGHRNKKSGAQLPAALIRLGVLKIYLHVSLS